MKKIIVYSFWVSAILLTGGVFVGWANYFRADASVFENPKRVALNVEQKTLPLAVPSGSSSPQDTQNLAPQGVPNMPVAKPASTRKTKAS